MRIFLIGFMGCGKTTSGKKLAAALNCPFYDLDHQIAAASGQSIAAYFAAHGEEAFRTLERDTLQQYQYPADCVISTGGGTPCFFDNMDWMNDNGSTVFIDMPAAALAKRLEPGKHKRPLIKDLDGEELVTFISDKLEGRMLFYKKAKVVVNGVNLNTALLKDAINSAI
jgi:shikimate kinase